MRLVAALALVTATCAQLPVPTPAPGSGSGTRTGGSTTPSPTGNVATDIVVFTNDARARNGLPALRTSAPLMEAARIHAEQMAANQRAEHTIASARYPTMQSRLQAVGYTYSSAAENVAWNQPSAQRVVDGWLNSAGHRANILDRSLTEMGAAMARSARGEPYWIQLFGTPR